MLNIIPLNYSLIIFYRQIKGIYKNIDGYATIKDINKLETLKDLSYLIIDKTNYITENVMKLKDTYSNQIHNEALIKNGLLALNFLNNDKIKQALEEVNTQYIDDYKLIKKYPYNNKTKITASIYEKGNEKYIYAIGGLESIFDISNLDVEQKYKLYTFQKDLHKKGLHIMAVSSDIIENEETDFFNYNLHFDGIIAFYEPLKENINNIIKEIQNMNINILMLTNDNELISKKIGKDISLNNYEKVISNIEINELDDINKLKEVGIITNISDKNKERLIDLLIKNNKVGITINDIDDLKPTINSNIRICINKLSSDLIKDKSDLILKNDDLNLIIKAIKNSKLIYNNIKNILKYLVIITSITVIITSIISILFNFAINTVYIFILICIYVILSIVLYNN